MHRILLIDDDEHLAAPLATYLRRFDLQLHSATRPSAALMRDASCGARCCISIATGPAQASVSVPCVRRKGWLMRTWPGCVASPNAEHAVGITA